MNQQWQRLQYRIRDRIRNGTRTRKIMAYLSLLAACVIPWPGRFVFYDRFLRWHPGGPGTQLVFRQAVRLVPDFEPGQDAGLVSRALIIKAPGPNGERGYLMVSFESELNKLVHCPQFSAMQEQYDLLYMPSWIPFYDPALYRLVKRASRPNFVLPSSYEDYQLCRGLHTELIALPLNGSSWVNPNDFPMQIEKDIDIVMLANFSAFKRHWLLFDALGNLSRDLRVVIAGPPLDGRTKADLEREAALFGAAGRVEIWPAQSYFEGAALHARSRISLALSAREGACNAVAEALMANTPVGMYANAFIGSKVYINEQTGVLFNPARPLAPQIMAFLERVDEFEPAKWAHKHIASTQSSQKLNRALREHSLAQGLPWRRDIVLFSRRRLDYYYDNREDEQALAPAYTEFAERYGLVLQRPGPIPRLV